MGSRGASLFPSLRRRERSEFHGSKLEGGRKGGMTAFSLSLGSRVKGAPLLSWSEWNVYMSLTITRDATQAETFIQLELQGSRNVQHD